LIVAAPPSRFAAIRGKTFRDEIPPHLPLPSFVRMFGFVVGVPNAATSVGRHRRVAGR